MNNLKKMLIDMVGDHGLQALEKAIYKRRSQSIIDPAEQLLGLLTAPRTLLSWLIQTVKPMKPGETKDIKFPGQEDIDIHIEKQDIDVYRAEFVRGGKVIHEFEKQSLPAFASHLVTTGEIYEDSDMPSREDLIAEHKKLIPVLESPSHEDDKEEAKEQRKELKELESGKSEDKQFAMPQAVLALNGLRSPDSEADKWMWAHANVKELVGVIGKLSDALVAKHAKAKDLDKKELSEGDPQKITEGHTTEEVAEAERKKAKKDPATIDEGMTAAGVQMYGMKAQDKINEAPKSKEIKRKEGEIKKEELAAKSAVWQTPFSSSNVHNGHFNDVGAAYPKLPAPAPKVESASATFRTKFGGKKKPKKPKKIGLITPVKKEAIPEIQAAQASQNDPKHPNGSNIGIGRLSPAEVDQFVEAGQFKQQPQLRTPADQMQSPTIGDAEAAPSFITEAPAEHNAGIGAMTQQDTTAFFEQGKLTQPGSHPGAKGMGSMTAQEAAEFFQAGKLVQDVQVAKPAEQLRSATTGDGQAPRSFLGKDEMPPHSGLSAARSKLRKLNKGSVPGFSGAGIQQKAKQPKPPLAPVPPSRNPKAASDKQAQASARGQQVKPSKQNTNKPISSGKPPSMKKSYDMTENDLYNKCPHCGQSEFQKTESGPQFKPCACFMVEKHSKEQFVSLSKSEQGYKLTFNPKADPESVRAFLLTLKLSLLANKIGR